MDNIDKNISNNINIDKNINDIKLNSRSVLDITFTFISLYPEDIDNYKKVLSGRPNIEFACNDIADMLTKYDKFDAVVSPANSFGFMDRGVDTSYMKFFGDGLQKSIQNVIREKYHGELAIGTGMILNSSRIENPRYMINTPTVRIPGDISNTLNVYYAFKALLSLLEKTTHDIKHVLVPCLGAGSGRMPSRRSAEQIKMAFDAFDGSIQDTDSYKSILSIITNGSFADAKKNDIFMKEIK